MIRIKKLFFGWIPLFLAGGCIYPIIEILFRGYSHVSMALLGGISLVVIRLIDILGGRLRLIWKAFLSSVIITQLEFIFGVVLNLGFGMHIWDYSSLPFQIAGQISLLFSFYWFLLSGIALLGFRLIFPNGKKQRKRGA